MRSRVGLPLQDAQFRPQGARKISFDADSSGKSNAITDEVMRFEERADEGLELVRIECERGLSGNH
ncbi:hypothetical protein GCM10022256_16910 [Frondihabitans peucedani]|uniref:Uncharacterized protein n=1 Tax=Frondihabitans peucedani TaxID=598626 RepID=A0ABP8E244_9MICO